MDDGLAHAFLCVLTLSLGLTYIMEQQKSYQKHVLISAELLQTLKGLRSASTSCIWEAWETRIGKGSYLAGTN